MITPKDVRRMIKKESRKLGFVSQQYVDKNIGGGGSSIFPVWAEENSTLGSTNTYEWAFGNGANTPAGGGVLMSVPPGYTLHCYAMGIKMNNTTGSATVELLVNGTPQGSACNVAATANGGALADVNNGTPIGIADGDLVNFMTTSSSGTSGPCVVVAWFILEAA